MNDNYPKDSNLYLCDDNGQIIDIFFRPARGNGKSTQTLEKLRDILEEKASKNA